MKKAFITGATGFIGKALVEKLAKENITVVALVRDVTKAKALFSKYPDVSVEKCDLNNICLSDAEILANTDNVFYNLAWDGVYGPKRNDLLIQLNNIVLSKNSVYLAKSLGCKRFLGLGTIMETESHIAANTDGIKPGPGYIYGMAKDFANLETKIECEKMDLDHIWVKATNVYGIGDTSQRLINSTLNKIYMGEELFFTKGNQLYDFIYIDDLVNYLFLLGVKGNSFFSYLAGSNEPKPLKDYLNKIIEITGCDKQKAHFGDIPYNGGELTISDLSSDKLVKDTGYMCKTSFEEGIEKTYNWVKEINS